MICRISDTDIVASDATSFANASDRGTVVKTTKYGIDEPRENVTKVGKVICNVRNFRYTITFVEGGTD